MALTTCLEMHLIYFPKTLKPGESYNLGSDKFNKIYYPIFFMVFLNLRVKHIAYIINSKDLLPICKNPVKGI